MSEKMLFCINNLNFSLKKGIHESDDYQEFLEYLKESLTSEKDINAILNKWSSYYSWFFKVLKIGDTFNIVEMDFQLYETYGIDNAISLLKKQLEVCSFLGLVPQRCSLNDKVLLSREILNGIDINTEGIRLKVKEGSSSWVLVSENWDGNYNSLSRTTLSEVAEKRVDLLPLLFLPSGYRFLQEGHKYPVEYDNDLLNLNNLFEFM